jgi:hypothetical protein
MWRMLRRGALAAGGLVVIVGLYLQTGDGFTRVLVPVVDRLVDADVTVHGGRLRLLDGTLEVSGLTYRDRGRGFAVALDEGRMRMSLYSLVTAARPLIHDFDVHGATIDTGLPVEDPPEERAAGVFVPITARRVRIDGLTLRSHGDDRVLAVLGPVRLTADDVLAPEGEGRLVLASAVQLDPADPENGYEGQLGLTLDVFHDGAAWPTRWDGSGALTLNEISNKDLPPLEISWTLDGTAQWPEDVTATLDADATIATETLGGVTLEVATRNIAAPTAGPPGERITAAVTLRSIAHTVLNPFLSPMGQGELLSGAIDGNVELETTPALDFLAFDGMVAGRNLQLDASGTSTPRIDVSVSERGSWSAATEMLRLERLELSLRREGMQIVESRLLRPLSLDLGASTDGTPAGAGEETLRLRTRVTGADLDSLGAWLRFGGVNLPDALQRAIIDADVTVGVNGDGNSATAEGDVHVSDLRVALAEGGPPLDSLDIRATLLADISPASGARIRDSKIRITRAGADVARAQIGGAVTWDPWTSAVELALTVPDVGTVAGYPGFRDRLAGWRLRGGGLHADVTARREPDDPALRLDGTMRLDGLVIVDAPAAPLRGSVAGGEVTLGAARVGEPIAVAGTMAVVGVKMPAAELADVTVEMRGEVEPAAGVRVDDCAIALRQKTQPVASIGLHGPWSWQSGATDLRVTVELADVSEVLRQASLLPVAMQSRIRGGRALGEYRLTRGARDAPLGVSGVLRAENLALPGPVRRGLRIDQDLRVGTKVVTVKELRLTSMSESGSELGTVMVNGMVPRGGAPGEPQLHATLAPQEAAPWLAVAGLSLAPAAGGGQIGGAVDLRGTPATGLSIEGRETVRLRAPRGSGTEASVVMRLAHELTRAGGVLDFSVDMRAEGNGRDRELGDHATVRGRYRDATSRRRATLEVSGVVDSLDLTDLAPALQGARSSTAPGRSAGGSPATRGRRPQLAMPTLPMDVTADLSVTQLRYRELEVRSGKMTADLGPDVWRIDLKPTRFASGAISGVWNRRLSGSLETVDFEGTGEQLDVTRLSQSLGTGDVQLDGVVDFSASGSARVPRGADIIPDVKGQLKAEVDEGRLRGLNLMAFLANRTGLTELKRIPLDSFDVLVDAHIADGAVHFDEAYVFGNLAKFQVTGEAGVESMNLTVQTFVFPSLARTMQGLGIKLDIFGAIDRMTGLPMATRVRGPYRELEYAAVPAGAFTGKPPDRKPPADGADRGRAGGAHEVTAPSRDAGAPRPEKLPKRSWVDGVTDLFTPGKKQTAPK